METRANFILIGLFSILSIVGGLLFFVWLASVQIDRQYAQYGILFENVSGLNSSGDVLFNGVDVGQVTGIRIWEDDPSRVFVQIEIDAATPIRTDTVGQLKSQGVTGVAYIELSGGSPNAPALTGVEGAIPVIQSQRSTVQSLVEDAPDLITDASELMAQLQALTGPENQARVTQILSNIEASSGRLDAALTDFSEITETVRQATAQITIFTDRLDVIGASVETTLTTADETLASATRAFSEAETVLQGTTEVIDSAQSAFASVDTLMQTKVPEIADQVSQTLDTFGTRSERILGQFGETATLANARLVELETTLAAANSSFAAVTQVSETIDTWITEDATLLVADARSGMESLQNSLDGLHDVIQNDVPAIVSETRSAITTANATIAQVSTDISATTQQLEPLLLEARQTLTTVSDTFAQSGATIDQLNSTLASAEQTFDGATALIDDSLDPVMADIRTSAARISESIETLATNAPEITNDLRALIARTDATVASLQQVINRSAPNIRDFSDTGLAQFTRLAQEARALVASLNSLSQSVQDDPTGLILDNRVPDYRR